MSSHQQPQRSEPTAVIRLRKVPSLRRRDGLIQYAGDITSQNGEDGIIERIFQLVPPPQRNDRNNSTDAITSNCKPTRFCVDVGAWDGVHLSNTRSLLCNSSQRWCGILIEADSQKFEQLIELYGATNNVLVNLSISVIDPTNNPNSLHHILKNQFDSGTACGIDTDATIDFLCIDIDGPDYFVLSDLFHFSHYRPIVICIEFNPTMPNDLVYLPPRSDSQRHVSKTIEDNIVLQTPEVLHQFTVAIDYHFIRNIRAQVLQHW
jgi:hypothetical protein